MQNPVDGFSARWVRIALAYFLLAVGLGLAMAAMHDFRLKGVHVHLNLLGWVSAAVTGLVYRLFPHAAASRLAAWHFWLYNLSLPVMMAGLALLLLDIAHGAAEPVVAVSSIGVLVSVLMFALNIWRQREASARAVDSLHTAAH